jgi:ribonucleoside-diphosphate reductase alpha chain
MGKRAGAVTTALSTWHLDLPQFLELQSEHGDQRSKAYDVFLQLVVQDEFMRRVEANEVWTLVDPYEVKTKLGVDLVDLWGPEFEKAYKLIEESLSGDGTKGDLNNPDITLFKRVNAKEVFKTIMKTQLESGLPYLAFKDTINTYNPNKHDGVITHVNLCVNN